MSVCLSMIVKNEGKILSRCLASVKPYIDCYAICDTGSTDDTCGIIKEQLSGIQGSIHLNKWFNFSDNRNMALKACAGKADYILTLDADEIICGSGEKLVLDKNIDSFYCETKHGDFSYWRNRIVRNNDSFYYVGKTHEYITSKFKISSSEKLRSIWYEDRQDSSRRQSGLKYLEDICILSEEIKKKPKDARSMFYLAQSFRDADMIDQAIEHYQKRVDLEGWNEEVYYSLYQIAKLKYFKTGSIWQTFNDFMKAYYYRSCRLEALTMLCCVLRQERAWETIYHLSSNKSVPNQDILFVTPSAEWQIINEHAIAAYNMNRKPEAKACFEHILKKYSLNQIDKLKLESNLLACQA